MKLFDCHLHTDLSFDSREPMENYVKQAVAAGDDYFISTEHFDLESHIMDGGDIAADLDRQQQIIAKNFSKGEKMEKKKTERIYSDFRVNVRYQMKYALLKGGIHRNFEEPIYFV